MVARAYHSVDPDVRRHIGQMPVVGLTQLGRGAGKLTALPEDGRRVVVFVHGLGGAPGNFSLMRTYFRLRGRKRTYSLALDGAATIAEMGAQLNSAIEEIASINSLAPLASVDLVAHSMGGLVARAALLASPESRRRIATLVTLGTPHSGTYAARYGYTPSMLDLRPGSELCCRLTAQIPWRGPPRLVAFWSRSDVLLLPPESARVEGAENVEASGFSHYGYLFHPGAWVEVLGAIDG